MTSLHNPQLPNDEAPSLDCTVSVYPEIWVEPWPWPLSESERDLGSCGDVIEGVNVIYCGLANVFVFEASTLSLTRLLETAIAEDIISRDCCLRSRVCEKISSSILDIFSLRSWFSRRSASFSSLRRFATFWKATLRSISPCS